MKTIFKILIALLCLGACTNRQQTSAPGQKEPATTVSPDSLPEGSCHRCMASGRITCYWCQGEGMFSCGGCGGKGYNYYSMGRLHRKTCELCGGKGKLHCTICDGSGHVMCDSCVGTGKTASSSSEETKM